MFVFATLLPVPFLVLAAFFGGVWGWGCLLGLTVVAFALDEIAALAPKGENLDAEFPASDKLSVALAYLHFPLLWLAIWAISGGSDLSGSDRVAVFFAFGVYFGQVSVPNAHELIHRVDRSMFDLGKWVFISILFGHHTSAHRLVHHRFVGTLDDPNSAQQGVSFYKFVVYAWFGSLQAGWNAETTMRNETKGTKTHPYLIYGGGAVLFLALAGLFGGFPGLFIYIALAAYVSLQLLLSDYVQHYGLTRWPDADDGYETVGPQHSWNAPHWFPSRMMLNAPRHSDHHLHPARPYPDLELRDDVPMLPFSLPVMGIIALFPRTWRRVMDRRVAEWSDLDHAAN